MDCWWAWRHTLQTMESNINPPNQAPMPAAQGSGANSRSVSIGVIGLVLAVIIAALWWMNVAGQDDMRETIAQELARRDASIEQRLALVGTDHENLTVLREKVKTLETELDETRNQSAALELKYQDLMQSRDERLLADIEQSVTTAAQQLQLAGNVEGALIVLQAADARLATNASSRFVSVRRSLARDIERLKASGLADVSGATLKLENVVAAVDGFPLAFEQRPKSAPPTTRVSPKVIAKPAASAVPTDLGVVDGLRQMIAEIWQDARQLVRIERLDLSEQALLTPPQIYFLRENLKLRLLSARVALLQRNGRVYREELQQAQRNLTRFFDTRATNVQMASDALKQLMDKSGNLELPNLDETLSTIRLSKQPRKSG